MSIRLRTDRLVIARLAIHRLIVDSGLRTICAVAASATLLSLAPSAALALPDDSTQPIQIQADRAELDQRKGTALYIGAVQLVQGTLTVTSARLTISSVNGEVTKILAEGDKTPAHYSQRAKPDQPPLLANAHSITYLTKDGRIRLEGDAHLTQGKNAFQGPIIDYDLNRQLVTANGGTGHGGVRVTIDPNRVERPGAERSSADPTTITPGKSEVRAGGELPKVEPTSTGKAVPATPDSAKPEPAKKH